MGSKTKFWYRRPGQKILRLFKYPHADTGEHWAEKIAAEVADLLDIPHAETTLAFCGGTQGSSSRSFVGPTQELFHGNQEMSGALDWYDPQRRFRQSDHTLANIFATLDEIFIESKGRQGAKLRIADYLVFDALIGNTDRHHENWGTLRQHLEAGDVGEIAPSFDHASSLGRELRDAGEGRNRRQLLDQGRVGAYSERARGGVYWSPDEPHAPSPLELVRRAIREFPTQFGGALERVCALEPAKLRDCIVRVRSDWMSDTAKEFALELMCYNLSELRKLLT